MSTDNDFDYWTQWPTASEKPSASDLDLQAIHGVEPLDAQLGVAEPLTVPAMLQDALFGQPEPTEADLARATGGDTGKVPPLHTYAVLDAAKVTNLPEMLDASGLEHRCLFKGDAYDELKDVAPWIARLEEGNRFTRNLFTRSDVPWHMWDSEPGIYVRSCGTFDAMWKHFRKFTKVQDEQGKWFYFRFWEPNAFIHLLEQPDTKRLLTAPDGCAFYHFYAPTKDATYVVTAPDVEAAEIKPFKLSNRHRTSFDAAIESKFARDYAVSLARSVPVRASALGIEGHDALGQMVTSVTEYLKPFGFSKRSDLGRMASCALFYGTHFLHDPRIAGLSQRYLTDAKSSPGLRAKRFQEALHKTVPIDVMTNAASVTKTLSQLRYALDRKEITQDYLAQVYTPEFGFHNADTAQQFIRTCQSQQQAKSLHSSECQMAHYILSALYTPYFLDDPLQEKLKAIFRDADDLKHNLLQELERRSTILEKT
ncbi:DUF4123 domain-containing protein [Litoreibacter arenae]|uniref:DUF4123 domain-containing protein n=1 Tax=Litoreibacter arenae DSM 19593 TaxID=1123360 RepID=S9RQC7_9RHOB|nr:DUF4123 domain-containing protein [Litoreibacter arenae]EPX80265.1 hypothetical protein thalar_01605 [Litoreibacter arenae DSM 19593]